MGTTRQTGWIDVQVRTNLDAGELIGALHDPSVSGAWQDHDGTAHIYWPAGDWNDQQLTRLRTVLLQLGDGPAVDSLAIREEPAQDWNRFWAQSVTPLRIGRRVLIRPSWEPPAGEPGTIELVIDPKLAFGTGHHPTTSMLIEWIEELTEQDMSVLDVGTGTGILAMVTLRCGAKRAVGLDCDPQAVDYAKGYAVENGFDEAALSFVVGTVSEEFMDAGHPWHLVLANLDGRTLLENREPLARLVHQGATLLLSGILIDQKEEIGRAYAETGVYVSGVKQREGWVALRMNASESCDVPS